MSYFLYNGKKIHYEEYGEGEALILLHGNTVSGRFFTPLIPLFSDRYRVIVPDYLGCGESDRLDVWPSDLWYEWSREVVALCNELKLTKVKVLGTSGGALVALNMALENPELVECVVADSFEGLKADSAITESIKMGRSYAKKIDDFVLMLKAMHGEDWESVFDSDTEAVVSHAEEVGSFFHKGIGELKVRTLLTGSDEDEMFPSGHYEKLFGEMAASSSMIQYHIFPHGGHPAVMSNSEEFFSICCSFFQDNLNKK